MDKQELYKEVKNLDKLHGDFKKYVEFESVLHLVSQLKEPHKVTIPQFVANWIEYCKNTFLSLVRALMVEEVDFYNYANQKDRSRLIDF